MRPLLLLALLGVSGCSRGFFTAHGTVASEGPGRLGPWRSTPQGCIRAPGDRSGSILALLWEDPGKRDPKLDNPNWSPDAPIRLEFSRADAAAPVVATLETMHHLGISLDASSCTVLSLRTSEHAAQARPSLSGEVELDCRAKGNHLIGHVTFERCSY